MAVKQLYVAGYSADMVLDAIGQRSLSNQLKEKAPFDEKKVVSFVSILSQGSAQL